MAQAASTSGDAPVRILAVEDDAVELTHLTILLEELGYEVVAHADNALDAMVAFAQKIPDLVVLDIHLRGETDGVGLAHKLRELSDVPVLFLTAFNDRDTYEEARRTLPHAYLTKPVEPLALQSAVELALQQYQRVGVPDEGSRLHQSTGGYFLYQGGKSPQKDCLGRN
jgi:CheY-like chemotaxis protein